jgi:plastocyanin
MATAQTTYETSPRIGLPGQIANEENSNVISKIVETAAGIGFGQPAARSATAANENNCRLMVSGAVFLGIAVLNRAAGCAEGTDEYEQYKAAALMTQGSIFVTAGGTVAPGDDVTWNTSTGEYSTTAADGTNLAIPDARFETNGGDGDIVMISLGNRRV